MLWTSSVDYLCAKDHRRIFETAKIARMSLDQQIPIVILLHTLDYERIAYTAFFDYQRRLLPGSRLAYDNIEADDRLWDFVICACLPNVLETAMEEIKAQRASI